MQSNSNVKNKSDLRSQPHSPYQIGRVTASNFNKPSGMTKLQQLKAYQPPKLDYLAQMKRGSNQGLRGTLISADASNIHTNPRLISKQGWKQINDRQSSINRNDPNRDSLQSRLIERIHSKKINHKKKDMKS
jgi:hypothetical protein